MNFKQNLTCVSSIKQLLWQSKKRQVLSSTLVFLLILSLFGSISFVQSQSVVNSLAQSEQTGDELIVTEDMIAVEQIAQAVNPNDPYSPSVLPGNVFYPMKNLWRRVKVTFTFNLNKKADMRIMFTNEKMVELNSLADLGMMNKVAEELGNYAKELEKMEELVIKTRQKDPEAAVEMTKKIMKNQIHHYVIGNKFERETPVEFLDKIRESKDDVTNSIGSLISNLGTPEDIRKAMTEDVESLIDNGTEFKQMHALGALKTVGEKVSLAAKDAVEFVNKDYTTKMSKDLEGMNDSSKEKFVDYASQNNGNEVVQAEILDDLSVVNTDEGSYEKIIKTKETLYKNFNARIADAEQKSPEVIDGMFNNLDDGEIKDLRLLKDLERNINIKPAQDKVKDSKQKSLNEISKNIKDENKNKFLNNISNKPDIKQLAVLNDIENASNINDLTTATKIDEAKSELVKKINYSVNLMSYDDIDPNQQGAEGGLPIESIKKIFSSCIEDGMCSNMNNTDPEDAKIIEHNKVLLGAQLSDRLMDINKRKVLILIKTLEDLKSLDQFEQKLKTNMNPEDIERFSNEMNDRTAHIWEMRDEFRNDDGPSFTDKNGEKIYCPYEFIPVCGVDGRTHNNRCFAEKISNIKIEYEGQCKLKYFTASGETVLCSREYQPVCGVDGKEYSNRCYAERVANVKIKHDGKCGPEDFTQSFNNIGPVMTAPSDQLCLPEYNPVCGEDNKTYQSFCYAEKIARVRVVSKGKCGDIAASNTNQPLPYTSEPICYPEYSPVCGEDGRTYQSFCFAEKINHVKVIYKGKCGEPMLEQDPNKIIQIDPNNPTNVVYCDKIYKPVCGMDGKTYENICVANKINNVLVKYDGACGSQPPPTQVIECPTDYKPVCGNDNRSYANRCKAEQIYKVQVQYEGECKTTVPTCNYNKICDNNNGETNASCPSDCMVNTTIISCPTNDYTNADGKCNFSKCSSGCTFNSSNCPTQCIAPPTVACNYNKVCDSGETNTNCPSDCVINTNIISCPTNDYTNADGKCNFSKCTSGCNWDSTNRCPVSCKPTTTACPINDFTNVDGSCNSGKCTSGCTFNNTNTCPTGCKSISTTACPINDFTTATGACNVTKCANGCNINSSGCPIGCYTTISSYCGNGLCDSGESATTCANDCGTSSTTCESNSTKELCATKTTCKWIDTDNICIINSITSGGGSGTSSNTSTSSYCGDGTCNSSETTSNCAVDCPSTEAEYITLQEVKINTGRLQVNYSKNFSTCAHLLTTSKTILHTKNVFCNQGNGNWSDDPLSDFSVSVGDSVILCHGNNYNICSSIMPVTGYLEYCGDGICNGYDNSIDCPSDCPAGGSSTTTAFNSSGSNSLASADTVSTSYKKINPIIRFVRDVGFVMKSIFLRTVNAMAKN
ncbi:MAG: Kazal-type serine protease inhibitor domain-containing protein [bacterium]|nr:Kazal-type serine protease inhibitor domain-containing protein [bacterium]